MGIRTDLALENKKIENSEGFYCEKEDVFEVCFAEIKDEKKYGKRKGKYATLSFCDLQKINDFKIFENQFKKALNYVLKTSEKVLVVGLGNREITADSVGVKTAEKILATRHIMGNFAEKIGLKGLKSVASIVPNVLGKTGIEVQEIIKGIIDKTKIDTVIVIDALCAKDESRLFKTVQITDSGISPGSGVKNSRKEISKNTLGVNVIAIGVPTVIEYNNSMNNLIVTPKDCDVLTDRISEILALNLNLFLQPNIDRGILCELV